MSNIVQMFNKYVGFVLLVTFLFSGALLFPTDAFAEGERLTVTPLVFDEKAKIRDILKKNLSLTNNTNNKLDVYVFVNNIDEYAGEQEFQARSESNISESLANWIEITRAKIELEPGQTKQIPFLIHVSVYAASGNHHAQISFGWGSTKVEAKKISEREPKIAVNVEVLDDSKEALQLASFLPEKTFFLDNMASFSYLFENIGNRAVSPKGEIRIYNRRGEEVGAIGVNGDGAELLPNMTSKLGSLWDSDGKFGRYKALLDVEYGAKQRGTVQDTIFFWIIPWKKILFMFVLLSAVVAIATFLLHRRYELYNEYKAAVVPVQSPPNPGPAAFAPAQPQATHIVTQRNVHIPPTPPPQTVQPTGAVAIAKRAPAPTTEGNVVRLSKRS